MADNFKNTMNLEVLMNTLTEKVILVESDNDFIDVLFSFLTMPMATIIRLSHRSKPLPIGCIDNLYGSIESFDSHLFRTEECRSMLLNPRNAKESLLNDLKLKFDDCEPPKYFKCSNFRCRQSAYSFSYYKTIHCGHCKSLMDRKAELPGAGSGGGGGAFVKGPAIFIISDDFQVMPPFTATSSNLVAKLGFTGWNSIEERTIKVDADEVLNLVMRSLVSKEPMTETLLKDKHVSKLSNENPDEDIYIEPRIAGYMANIKEEWKEENMSIKLVISKSKNMVCYAEAGEDFINFLFSFLTLPLGFILKQMRLNSFDGCIDHLYKSVEDLDEQYLKSSKHKSALVSPKLPSGFGYKNNLLGILEASYHWEKYDSAGTSVKPVEFVDPKSPYNEDDKGHGFLKGPAMFMVTDRLNVSTISAILGMSVLCQLNVGVTDIEIKVVHVGKKEAFGLLVASFVSNSALTSVFLKKPNEGFGCFSFL